MPRKKLVMTSAQVIEFIRAHHLSANIGWIEKLGENPTHPVTGKPITIFWHKATVDPGGTVFGPGPYLHVPVRGWWGTHEITNHRVYPPKKILWKLQRAWVGPKPHDPKDKDSR